MDVQEIVEQYLRENGYDGLYNHNARCGCELSNLVPCLSEGIEACVAAHKTPCPGPEGCDYDGDCDWHMAPGPRPNGGPESSDRRIPDTKAEGDEAEQRALESMARYKFVWFGERND